MSAAVIVFGFVGANIAAALAAAALRRGRYVVCAVLVLIVIGLCCVPTWWPA